MRRIGYFPFFVCLGSVPGWQIRKAKLAIFYDVGPSGENFSDIGHQPLDRALVEPGALHGHAGQQAHGGLRAGHVAAGTQRAAEEAVEPLDPVGGVQGPLRRGGEAEVGEAVAVGLVPLQPAEAGAVPRPAGQEAPQSRQPWAGV